MSANPPYPPNPPFNPRVEPPHPSGTTGEERSWAMLCHLASLANLMVPFGAIVGPLAVWLIKKNESEFVDRHGKESVQFQASFFAYHMVFMCGGVGSFIALIIAAEGGGSKDLLEVLGPVAVIALFGLAGLAILMRIFVLITMIFAAVKANSGEEFRYPLTIRVL